VVCRRLLGFLERPNGLTAWIVLVVHVLEDGRRILCTTLAEVETGTTSGFCSVLALHFWAPSAVGVERPAMPPEHEALSDALVPSLRDG